MILDVFLLDIHIIQGFLSQQEVKQWQVRKAWINDWWGARVWRKYSRKGMTSALPSKNNPYKQEQKYLEKKIVNVNNKKRMKKGRKWLMDLKTEIVKAAVTIIITSLFVNFSHQRLLGVFYWSKWQQVFSGLQNSSEYSSRS